MGKKPLSVSLVYQRLQPASNSGQVEMVGKAWSADFVLMIIQGFVFEMLSGMNECDHRISSAA